MNLVTIIGYKPENNIYFEQLNKEWLEEYFVVEPIDEWVLENPEEAIIKPGGKILFALLGSEVVGTVALKKMEGDTINAFELTKMAVDKQHQGLGIGKILCRAAISTAGGLAAQKIILYSHTSLKIAINIYKKLGFIEVPLEKGKYSRADIKMELILNR